MDSIKERLDWLKDKLVHMQNPDSPDYTPVQVYRDRIKRDIEQLERELKKSGIQCP